MPSGGGHIINATPDHLLDRVQFGDVRDHLVATLVASTGPFSIDRFGIEEYRFIGVVVSGV